MPGGRLVGHRSGEVAPSRVKRPTLRFRRKPQAGLVTLKGFTTLQLVGREVLHTDAASGAVTTITKLRGDKRIKWQQAQDLLRDNKEVRGTGPGALSSKDVNRGTASIKRRSFIHT